MGGRKRERERERERERDQCSYSALTNNYCLPPSIFVRIVLVHFRNTSSTFSPVRALVSRKVSSTRGNDNKTRYRTSREKGQIKTFRLMEMKLYGLTFT